MNARIPRNDTSPMPTAKRPPAADRARPTDRVPPGRSRRWAWLGAAVTGSVALSACGATITPMTFDSIPPASSTTLPATLQPTPTLPLVSATTQPATAAAAWVDATANLVGHPAQCGGTTLVSVRPTGDRVLVGLSANGLYASDDGSAQWTQLAGSKKVDNRPSSILYDPDHPATFWESGAYGKAVYDSTNDGASMSVVGNIDHSDQVSVDFTEPSRRTMLSGTHEKAQVFRSTDGGRSWVDLSRSLPAGVGYASFPYVVNASTFLLGTRRGTSAGIFRSSDGGQTWKLLQQGAVDGPVAVTADGHLYWLLAGGTRLLQSGDSGATWTESDHSGPVSGLIALPGNRLAALGAQNVVVSSDRGATWTAVGGPLPYAPDGLAYSAARKSFYVWHSSCTVGANSPITAKAVMRLPAGI